MSGGQAGRPRPHHQHVAMRKRFFVPVVIALARRRTQAGRLADTLFVFGPQFLGPHERLVVEPGWNEARKRSEEHTSELQSLMRKSYAVFCLQKNNTQSTR